jgi:hypothetical protein
MLGISWQVENLLAFQEGFCPVMLVISTLANPGGFLSLNVLSASQDQDARCHHISKLCTSKTLFLFDISARVCR